MEGESGLWALFQRAPVDWTEPLVIGLLVFHVLCFVITIISFKFYKFQIVHFLIMVALVSSAEYINEYAALNLNKFSKQQYFDSSGMFISLAFSAPLLCNTIIIVEPVKYFTSDPEIADAMQVSCTLSVYLPVHLVQVHWVYKTLCVMTELKTLQKKRKSAREKKKEN